MAPDPPSPDLKEEILYTYMEETLKKSVMKYVLSSEIGKIKVNNKGKQLKRVIINEKEYPYNPSKPFTERLTKNLTKYLKLQNTNVLRF